LFRKSAPDQLYDALAPQVGDPDPGLGIAGFHYFTFNQLVATYEWEREKQASTSGRRIAQDTSPRGHVQPEERTT
jgi:hypothetical protein